jgi:hypothetical protein
MTDTPSKKNQPIGAARDAEIQACAERISRHAPPVVLSPDAARMVLIRMSLAMLLRVEKS